LVMGTFYKLPLQDEEEALSDPKFFESHMVPKGLK